MLEWLSGQGTQQLLCIDGHVTALRPAHFLLEHPLSMSNFVVELLCRSQSVLSKA
jgi:hypothetical protein